MDKNSGHLKVDEIKPLRLQLHIKKYRKLNNNDSGETILTQGRANQLVILCQMVSHENMHAKKHDTG